MPSDTVAAAGSRFEVVPKIAGSTETQSNRSLRRTRERLVATSAGANVSTPFLFKAVRQPRSLARIDRFR